MGAAGASAPRATTQAADTPTSGASFASCARRRRQFPGRHRFEIQSVVLPSANQLAGFALYESGEHRRPEEYRSGRRKTSSSAFKWGWVSVLTTQPASVRHCVGVGLIRIQIFGVGALTVIVKISDRHNRAFTVMMQGPHPAVKNVPAARGDHGAPPCVAPNPEMPRSEYRP